VDWVKTVFHVHTNYSDDGNAPVESVIAGARRAGVGCVVVTDHDTIDGALAMRAAAASDLKVVVGEEISTRDGHLVGLFLKERVLPDLTARATAERIRQQGGLVVVPHPFNTIFGCSLRDKVHEILDLIDVVEVGNAQNLSPWPDVQSAAFARRHGFPGIVGADMHHRDYLCPCFQWLSPFEGPESFLASLSKATLVPGRHPLSYFVRAARIVLSSRIAWLAAPDYGLNCNHVRGGSRVEPFLPIAD
jgi:hypothetical protein